MPAIVPPPDPRPPAPSPAPAPEPEAAPPPPPPPPPPPAPRPAPTSGRSRPEPGRRRAVLSRPERSAEAAAEDASLAAKAAPYAIVLLLLWILRRMFGSDDR